MTVRVLQIFIVIVSVKEHRGATAVVKLGGQEVKACDKTTGNNNCIVFGGSKRYRVSHSL